MNQTPPPATTGDTAAEAAGRGFDRAVHATHEAVDRAAASLDHAAQCVREGYDRACAVEHEWAESCRGQVREHPLAWVVGALAVGWLVGAVCSRSHR